MDGTLEDQRPIVEVTGVRREGVSAQRVNLPSDPQRVWDVRPAVTSGNGVSAQAQRAHPDKIPKVLEHPGGEWRIRARIAGNAKRER